MRVVLSISILLSLCMSACLNTEGTIEIGGRVMDDFSKQGISNRKVIVEGVVFNDESTIKHIHAGQFYTDSTGSFSYSLKKVKDAYRYHFCFVGDSNYTYYTKELYLNEIELNNKYLFFYLTKLTDLTIRIDRFTKIPLYDTLYVSWKSDGMDGKAIFSPRIINYGVAPVFEYKWVGGKVKSIIKTKTIAGKPSVICYELLRNGRKHEMYDTIDCQRDVNNIFNLKY